MAKLPLSLTIFQPTAALTLNSIVQAEKLGVPNIWVPAAPAGFDPLTLLAAAATKTSRIRLGTAIVPTYPRHPLALASQALVMAELAPGRFRLGVGSSHPFIIEGIHGLSFGRPLAHLREYITILRAFLWEGAVNFSGTYYRAQAQLPPGMPPPCSPLPIATVRAGMFRLAGEISDGALAAWCPLPYLLKIALPAMREGARAASRPTPPLIGNVPVVFSNDIGTVRMAARAALNIYTHAPTTAYLEMFAAAGFPIGTDRSPTDELIDELFAWGDADTIAARLRAAHEAGVDEVMVTVHPVSDPATEETKAMELIGALSAS
jgi:alkanesulfonate monooxygenase SsuD/methylene tetrahydromethanopterin reductase-like flavin-dependent oxidoreductase (luciferase family)